MNINTIMWIVGVITAVILVALYVKYWKHNIYGGNFKEHFKDSNDTEKTKAA